MAEPTISEPTIDVTFLESVRRFGGDTFLNKLVGLFLSMTPSRLERACEAVESDEMETVARMARAIQVSAGNVGALELRDLAARMEKLAEFKQAEALPTLLDQAVEAFARAQTALEEHVPATVA